MSYRGKRVGIKRGYTPAGCKGNLKKRSQRRPRRKLRALFSQATLFVLGVLLVTFFIYQGYQAVLRSSVFRLRGVIVEGNRTLSEEKVISLSGIELGSNLFEVDLANLEAKLRGHPLIRRARVSRRFPSGLLISIEERRPVAWINAGSLCGVDREGVLLPPFEPQFMPDLPIVTGLEVGRNSFGARITSPQLDLALRLLDRMERVVPDLVDLISEVNVGNPRDIRLCTTQGSWVWFGDKVDSDKMVALAAVLEDLEKRGLSVEYVDLRFKGQVVVKPRAKVARPARRAGSSSST